MTDATLNHRSADTAADHTKTGEGGGAVQALLAPPVLITVAIWFAVITWLGARGVFLPAGGVPTPAPLFAVLIPPALFVALYMALASVRAWVDRLDLMLITSLQSWRVLGGVFLALWAYGLLPGVFAIPAGFGDVAVGLVAPFVAFAVMTRSPGWRRASYGLIVVGLFDFVVAVGVGIASETGGVLHREIGRAHV